MSLSTKAIALTFALIVPIIALVLVHAYNDASGRLKNAYVAQERSYLEAVERNIETRLAAIDENARLLMGQEIFTRFVNGQPSVAAERFAAFELSKQLPGLSWTKEVTVHPYLYSRIEDRVLSVDGSYRFEDFFDTEILAEAMSAPGYFWWTAARTAPGPGFGVSRRVVTLVRPYPTIAATPSRRQGAVVVNVDLNLLSSFIERSDQDRLGAIYIIGKNKELIASSETGAAVEEDIDSILGEKGVHIASISSDYTGWRYLSVISSAEINAPLKQMFVVFTVSGLFFLAVTIIAVAAIGRYYIVPAGVFIRKVAENLEGPEGGSSPLPRTRKDLDAILREVQAENRLKLAYLAENKRIRRWRVMENLIAGGSDAVEEAAAEIGLSVEDRALALMLLRFEPESPADRGAATLYLKRRIGESMEALLADDGLGSVTEMQDHSIIAVIRLGGLTEDSARTLVLGIFDTVRGQFADGFRVRFFAGASLFAHSVSTLPHAYREAVSALDYRLLGGTDPLVFFADVQMPTTGHFLEVMGLTGPVIDALKMADPEGLERGLDTAFLAANRHRFGMRELRLLSFQILLRAAEAVGGFAQESADDPAALGLLDRINAVQDAADLRRLVTERALSLLDRMRSLPAREGAAAEAAKRVLDYLGEHCMESDLSLKSIAFALNLSVPYLSTVFKEASGTNFMYHLIRLRMEKAKDLLSTGTERIAEIAVRVGYLNTHSFNRIFRQYTGVAPGEYRERFQRK